MPSVLGMKPEAPKSMQRRITAGSSLAETTTTGTLGYCARRYISPENPRTPGMVEVEQDEIDLAAALEQLRDVVERAGLGDVDLVEQAGHGLAQRPAKQRMVVGDDQTIATIRPLASSFDSMYSFPRPPVRPPRRQPSTALTSPVHGAGAAECPRLPPGCR